MRTARSDGPAAALLPAPAGAGRPARALVNLREKIVGFRGIASEVQDLDQIGLRLGKFLRGQIDTAALQPRIGIEPIMFKAADQDFQHRLRGSREIRSHRSCGKLRSVGQVLTNSRTPR